MENDPIQDYILKNKRNLRIAAAVGEAWSETRQKLVLDFLDRLGQRLKKKLKEWRFEPYGGPFYVQADSGYYFWKPAWVDQYSVGLYWDEHGKEMIFGVSRDKDKIGRRRHSQELFDAIAKLYPSAKPHSWWEAWVPMTSPASDWSKPDVLWQMHTDTKFVEDVAEQLLGVAKVSEKIIDRLARMK